VVEPLRRSDGFVFSDTPDGAVFPIPDSVSQRYERLVRRLGIATTLHKLRHYSATELILAGIDVRTVAGRLGHGGGGTTTLRTYTAWVSEADQRAASGWSTRMPTRAELNVSRAWIRDDPRHPYERIAAELARQVETGELRAGELAPKAEALAADHGVSLATARRAMTLAKDWGALIADNSGRPRIARRRSFPPVDAEVQQATTGDASYWSVVVSGPGGERFAARTVRGDLARPDSFRSHLIGIVRAERPDLEGQPEGVWVGDYELHLSRPGQSEPLAILRLG
jgi:hypothetical protein